MPNCFLGLGSNLGERAEILETAIKLINDRVGKTVSKSSLYETDSWGNLELPKFLNQVICIDTKLSVFQVFETIMDIENILGRVRVERWGSRTIDIDILFYDGLIVNEERLQVPHPRLQHRKFVLVPMVEIFPDWEHPILLKDLKSLLNSCTDELGVRLWVNEKGVN